MCKSIPPHRQACFCEKWYTTVHLPSSNSTATNANIVKMCELDTDIVRAMVERPQGPCLIFLKQSIEIPQMSCTLCHRWVHTHPSRIATKQHMYWAPVPSLEHGCDFLFITWDKNEQEKSHMHAAEGKGALCSEEEGNLSRNTRFYTT